MKILTEKICELVECPCKQLTASTSRREVLNVYLSVVRGSSISLCQLFWHCVSIGQDKKVYFCM